MCFIHIYLHGYYTLLSCFYSSGMEFGQQVLDQLATKSAALNLKVGKIDKYVGDLKCGFSSDELSSKVPVPNS